MSLKRKIYDSFIPLWHKIIIIIIKIKLKMLNGTIQRLVFICVFQLNKLRLSRHIVCRGISELEGGRDLFFCLL